MRSTPAAPLRRSSFYAGDTYIQHNPHVADGKQTFVEYLDYAGIDVLRLDADGKVVEHWDVLQVVQRSAANDNGMV